MTQSANRWHPNVGGDRRSSEGARAFRLSSAGTSISEVCTAGRCSRVYPQITPETLSKPTPTAYFARNVRVIVVLARP
jgi:hypothetical protein